MRPGEAIALIGTGYVLISLYRVLGWAERRCQAMWYRRKRRGNARGHRRGK